MKRRITDAELMLLQTLLDYSAHQMKNAVLADLMVEPMADGGMGSLRLIPPNCTSGVRKFGTCISEVKFKDTDGVTVLVSLNLDREGNLFELDIWKTDFSKLILIPDKTQITREQSGRVQTSTG